MSIFDPVYAFIFAGLFSPGPNVILLLTSGARFGARETWPHIIGVAIGVGIIGACVRFGIEALLIAHPELAFLLKCIAALWILWMAWGLYMGLSVKCDIFWIYPGVSDSLVLNLSWV